MTPAAMGRRSLCENDLGVRDVELIQSWIGTLRLHGIDPYRYSRRRAVTGSRSTPLPESLSSRRVCGIELFTDNPLRSDLHGLPH